MAQKFKETAHLHTDMEKYGEGYDRIFGKKDSKQDDAHQDSTGHNREAEEKQRVKELARKVYYELGSGQDTEGFPESSSFIYGFCKGYQAARREQ
jgi:hypothetical protein